MPVFQLREDPLFPNPHLADDSGLLAIGGDLGTDRLIQAYAHGIFPWYSEGEPIMWWSPDPRMILYPNKLKISKSLQQQLNKDSYQVSFDKHFDKVIAACAQVPRFGQSGTWITTEMLEAYQKLHEEGYAHSVEVMESGKVVGGLYGISLGKAFFGESMFYHRRDASKIALTHLVKRLTEWDFHFIDAQVETDHMIRMGAKNVPRNEFLKELEIALQAPTIKGKW